MAEIENSKDLISVLWSGADILRSKMDANEYKDYLLGIVFYKYLSDSFLIKVYDMICDGKPGTLKEALEAYEEVLQSEDGEELKAEMKQECHYVIEPELTYTCFADAARNNSFNREQLQKLLIILNKVILYLQICLRILICIRIVWEQETRNRVIQLPI